MCRREREEAAGRACPVFPRSLLWAHPATFPTLPLPPPPRFFNVYRTNCCLPNRRCRGRNGQTRHGIGILLGKLNGGKENLYIFFIFTLFCFFCVFPSFSMYPTCFWKDCMTEKMRINIFSWHFLGLYSALWGLATGAFPSSVQIGELWDHGIYARVLTYWRQQYIYICLY